MSLSEDDFTTWEDEVVMIWGVYCKPINRDFIITN